MSHDETTTEIEIPIKKPTTNILRVDFAAEARKQPAAPQRMAAPPQAMALPTRSQKHWFRDLDIGAPWILRLIAVGMIILLSLLIL